MSIDHYENFPVASVLCPPRLRPPIMAIYHFARTADDIADEGQASPAERLSALGRYRHDLEACRQGQPSREWPQVFSALHKAIRDFALPLPLLHALLDAFVQDCSNPTHADRASLLAYCANSANPVGRLLLHLNGVDDAVSLAESDAICSALQLINFWQDPSVDLARGRSYFPSQDVQRLGIDMSSLQTRQDTPGTRALLTELCDWAEHLMLQGSALPLRLPGRVGWELRLVVQGGLRILAKIRAMNHATLSARPKLGPLDLPTLLWRAALMRPTPTLLKAHL